MHVPDAIRTRELNFLEIFWEGLALFQQHLPTIAIVTLAVNLPFHIALPFLPGFIFHLLAGRGLGEVLGSVASDEAASISLFDELEYLLPPLAIALAVTAIAFGLVQSLSHAAVCLTVERSLYGEFLDGVQALKLAVERLLATFWTNLLVALNFLVAIAFGSVMGVFTGTNVSYFLYFRHIETFGNIQQDLDIPMGKIQTIFAASILAWVLLLVVGMFVSYAFSACAAALRPAAGSRAIKWSQNLTRGRFFKSLFFLIGLFFVPGSIALSLAVSLGSLFSSGVLTIVSNTLQSFVLCFAAIAQTLFFLNLDYLFGLKEENI